MKKIFNHYVLKEHELKFIKASIMVALLESRRIDDIKDFKPLGESSSALVGESTAEIRDCLEDVLEVLNSSTL